IGQRRVKSSSLYRLARLQVGSDELSSRRFIIRAPVDAPLQVRKGERWTIPRDVRIRHRDQEPNAPAIDIRADVVHHRRRATPAPRDLGLERLPPGQEDAVAKSMGEYRSFS